MQDKNKVALFSTNFLEYSQTFIYDELRHHTRYDVEVFSHQRLNPDRFNYDRVNFLAPAATLQGAVEAAVYNVTTYSPTFMRRIREGNFQLIHAHFGPGSIYALPYQKATGLPMLATYHGYDVPLLLSALRFHPRNWRYWARSGAMFRQVSRFLAASTELHDLLLELGAPPEKVKIWRLGIEIPALSYPAGRTGTKIMMVGRFVEKKGFEYGIEALGKVAARFPGAKLQIAGSGDRRANYDQLIGKLGLDGRVEFLGVLPHAELLARMSEADVFLAPSVVAEGGNRESGLLVAKEAGARFVPVIGTLHGGIPEIIDDGETGYLVPERDSEAIAEKLALLLNDEGLRVAMGHKAREKMEREYDIVRRIAVLEEHYDEVREEYARRK